MKQFWSYWTDCIAVNRQTSKSKCVTEVSIRYTSTILLSPNHHVNACSFLAMCKQKMDIWSIWICVWPHCMIASCMQVFKSLKKNMPLGEIVWGTPRFLPGGRPQSPYRFSVYPHVLFSGPLPTPEWE